MSTGPIQASQATQPDSSGQGEQSATQRADRLGRWLRWGLWTLAGLVALVLAGTALVGITGQPQRSGQALMYPFALAVAVRHVGTVVQCLIVVWMFLYWRNLVGWGLKAGYVKRHEIKQVLRLRTKALAWAVTYLLLVPIGPATLWNALVGLKNQLLTN